MLDCDFAIVGRWCYHEREWRWCTRALVTEEAITIATHNIIIFRKHRRRWYLFVGTHPPKRIAIVMLLVVSGRGAVIATGIFF